TGSETTTAPTWSTCRAGYPAAQTGSRRLSCPWRSAAWRPILDHVNLLDLLGGLLGWFADLLPPLGEHLVHRQAGHAITRGSLGCSLKVMSGRQLGLSPRWRRGVVVISPGRLDFTPEPRWPRATRAITHLVVLGPSRPPSMEELTWLPADW